MSGKYTQKFLDHAKQSATYAFKTTLEKVIQKTGEATGDMIGSKSSDKITKNPKNLQQNKSETIANEHDKEKSKERDISPEERQSIIDYLGLS